MIIPLGFKMWAEAVEKAYGIPQPYSIAQAGIESGWGKNSPGCNYFGMKALHAKDGSLIGLNKFWTGKTQAFVTHEREGKKRYVGVSEFRFYPDGLSSWMYWGHLISTSKTYATAYAFKNDVNKWIDAISSVYSTAPILYHKPLTIANKGVTAELAKATK